MFTKDVNEEQKTLRQLPEGGNMGSQKNICLASVGFCSTGQYGHFNLKQKRTHNTSI
jgi:hypothetical protein